MPEPPVIVRFTADEWLLYRVLRLRALADSPEAFSTTLVEAKQRTEAQWTDQLSSGAASVRDHPTRAEVAGDPVGMSWTTLDRADRSMAHLYQMWVAPEHRGFGFGAMLLHDSIQWARSRGARHLALEVNRGNGPAMSLYLAAGFAVSGDLRPLRPGSTLLVTPMRLPIDRADP